MINVSNKNATKYDKLKKVYINLNDLEMKVTIGNGPAFTEIRIIICFKLIKHENKNLAGRAISL